MYKRLLLVVTLAAILALPDTVQAQTEITSWQAVNRLYGFQGSPNPRAFATVTLSEIKRLDTAGGELWFLLAPKDDPNCVQPFRVGWIFDRDVGIVREGESFNVQLFVQAQGDTGVGLRACYVRAKSRAYDGGKLVIQFRPSARTHHVEAPPYRKYHEGSAQYLFHKTTGLYIVDYEKGSGVDGFRVVDSPHPNNIGSMNALHGSLSFVIEKGRVFRYNITYLYDALATGSPPGDGMGRQWLVSESGWQGTWTRRGASNIFDAEWGSGRVTAVLTINVAGNRVTIARRDSSDGNDCDYTGTIAADGITVEGTYTCARNPGPFPWRAVIQR